jgi:hypothetical protein
MPTAEPTTMLTDYALSALGLVLALRLGGRARPLPARLWAAAFLAAALAAGAGGTLHGFGAALDLPARARLWDLVYGAIGLASFFILAGALLAVVPRRGRPYVLGLLALRFLAFLAFTLARDFRFVLYDLVLTQSVLLGTALLGLVRAERGAPFVLLAALLSLLGAYFQSSGVDLHPRFNHNDLFHVLQMGALWCLFRAGLRFRVRGGEEGGLAPQYPTRV